MESSMEQLIESLSPECAVCLLPYDDVEKTPRLLSCGHSISQDCGDLLIDSNYSPAGGEVYVRFGTSVATPQANAASTGLPSIPPEGLSQIVGARFGVVKCPECNQRTKVPAKGARGLPKNIELLRVISKLQGNDGSAKARRADLERKVNWAREIAEQAAAADSTACQDRGAIDAEVPSEGIQNDASGSFGERRGDAAATGLNLPIPTEADNTSLSANGTSASELFQSAREGSTGQDSGTSTAPSVDALRDAFQAGRSQEGDPGERHSQPASSDQHQDSERHTRPGLAPLDISQTPLSAPPLVNHPQDHTNGALSAGDDTPLLTALRRVLPGHQDSVSALAIVADQWLCSASFDRTVRVWSLLDGSPHGVLEGHQHRIMALATVSLLPEEASGVDADGIVCGNGRIIDNYVGGPGGAASIPRGADLLVSADYGGHICVWSVIRDTRVVRGPGESPEGTDHKPEASPGEPCPGPGKLLASWDAHSDWKYFGVLALAVAEGKVLYSGAGDRTIRAWSLGAGGVALGGLLGVLEGHTGPVSALTVDGELLYSGSWDGSVRGWWREDHTPVAVVHAGPGPGVRCLAMLGPRLIAGKEDGTLQVWVEGQPESEKRKAHAGVVSSLCVSGSYLYSGSWDGVIQVWPVDQPFSAQGPVAAMSVEGGPLAVVHALATARDRLFSAHIDTAIKVWGKEAG